MIFDQFYILNAGAVSATNSWEATSLSELVIPEPAEKTLSVHQPVYKQFIPPAKLRRMGRLLRMGNTAARIAMTDAPAPEGIVVGTALGCMDDTRKFLDNMIEEKEGTLSPTSFIQSTHNTLAGQIAVALKCQGYNQTISQRYFSLENALLDTHLQLSGSMSVLLAGTADELTPESHEVLTKLDGGASQIWSEGSAFFVCGNQPANGAVRLSAMIINPESDAALMEELSRVNFDNNSIDLIVSGAQAEASVANTWDNNRHLDYKKFSGHYFTANSFGLWYAVRSLQEGNAAKVLVENKNAGGTSSYFALQCA